MYNVKKGEAVFRKFPSVHYFALARLLCGAARFAKEHL